MDVLFGRPLSEILAELPLASNIRTALLGGSNVFRDVYEAALAYEAADWQRFQDAANRARLKESFVAEEYEAAVRQASSIGDRTA
jgi:c-di-GMP-related signal transduction protein